MNYILKLFKKLRKPKILYTKPIVSMYHSFNRRKIIYESACGKRTIKIVYRPDAEPFQIKTSVFMNKQEFEAYLTPSIA